MTTDLRSYVAEDLRTHPRVAYQGLLAGDEALTALIQRLPPFPSFRKPYVGAICVVDWDHRLPSTALALRIFAYYSDKALASGEEAYDDRLEEIGRRDRFPEFDVPDFDQLVADEAYEVELTPAGHVGRARLTSPWRREIARREASKAVKIAEGSPEFSRLRETVPDRPSHLGELEAVSWTPPCESQHATWTLDVWYLLAFDGRLGTGRSFLVDLQEGAVVAVRDFSVRTG
jgi:hypothetical protein